MKEENKKFILITGGASGIGLAIARQLYINNQNLLILDKNKIGLLNLKKSLVGKKSVLIELVDLSRRAEVVRFLNKLTKQKIIIEHLINNAGYQEEVDVLNLNSDQWKKLFTVNLEASLWLSQFVAKQIIGRKTSGSIINITSIHSQIIRGMAHYSSSKAALEMLTKELAYKLAKYNIRVNAIAPGAIITPLVKKDLNNRSLLKQAARRVPMNKLGRPEDVANVVDFLISDRAGYITGATIIVDGGLSLVI